MSVRIIYLERGDRGASIHRVRLVGPTSDQAWPVAHTRPDGPAASVAPVDASQAAAWIKEQLSQTRSTTSISMLCMDLEGSAMSWLSSPSADPAVVNVVARYGGGGGSAFVAGDTNTEGPRGNAAVDFYAPGLLDSTIQAVASSSPEGEDPPRRLPFQQLGKATGGKPPSNRRLPIIAMTDVPGRLMIDNLDDLGIPVEAAASLWHACALAWDPSWSPASAQGTGGGGAAVVDEGGGAIPAEVVATVIPTSATIIIDPKGKLIWCWSKGAMLLVGGTMRLRMVAPVAAGGVMEDETELNEAPVAVFGHDEVMRLTTEWLSWSAQTGLAPSRMTCVLPDGDPGMVAEFGGWLTNAWPGTTIDAAMAADPIAETLRRVAERLEQTPKSQTSLSPTASLVGLSTRHGREHRKMYTWAAIALIGLSGLVVMATFKMRELTTQAKERAADVNAQSASLVKEHFPDARVGPGYSLFKATSEQVERLKTVVEPAKRIEPPILTLMEELDTISMVVGNPQYALELIDLEARSTAPLQLNIIADNIADAEAMTEALNSIAGSHVDRWKEPDSLEIKQYPGKVLVKYTAKWSIRDEKAAKAAQPTTPASSPSSNSTSNPTSPSPAPTTPTSPAPR